MDLTAGRRRLVQNTGNQSILKEKKKDALATIEPANSLDLDDEPRVAITTLMVWIVLVCSVYDVDFTELEHVQEEADG